MSPFVCVQLWEQLDNLRGISQLRDSRLDIQRPKENDSHHKDKSRQGTNHPC